MTQEHPIPQPDEVISALEQTGFLFEQRVARLLGEDVSTGWAFEDPDSSVSREIDLYLSRVTSTPMDGRDLQVGWTLLGECKDYKTPWVVLTADYHPDGEGPPHSEVYMSDVVRDKLGGADDDHFIGNLTGFDNSYSRFRLWPTPRAVQLLTLRRKGPKWETHGGDIYNSVTYPLAKAVTVLSRRQAAATEARRGIHREFHLFFPVLIVSAPIFSVSLAEDGTPAVRQVDHVLLERVIESEKVRGKFRIDVLHVSAVSRWRTEVIPGVIRAFAEELGIDDQIDRNVVERLTSLHVPTMNDLVEQYGQAWSPADLAESEGQDA